jgi:hypothetical protein
MASPDDSRTVLEESPIGDEIPAISPNADTPYSSAGLDRRASGSYGEAPC